MHVTDTGFTILLEDGPVLVVAKPGGLATQAPPGIDSLESRIKAFLKARDEKPGKVYLGVPHRLDRPSSGVLVFAKHSRAARRLAEQFEGRLVQKTYLAIVAGNLQEKYGTWTDHIRKIPDKAEAEIVPPDHPEGREAVLRFEVIETLADRKATVLRIWLETGRMHQIRVQASARGHQVWGDHQYGSQEAFGPATDDSRLSWIALHAQRLAFKHPMTREPVTVEAPLPEPWLDVGVSYNG